MESYKHFSTIYDALMMEDIDYPKIAAFILDQRTRRRRYLDLGCGTGTLSLLIGKHFKETYLVDLSPEMLTVAEEKFREKSLSFRAFAISMEEIDFKESFDLITSSIDALNYLVHEEDILRVFQKVYTHLEEDGTFIFDIQSPYKIREIIGNNDYVYTSEDLAYTWENYFVEEDDVVEMTLNFFVKTGDYYERFEEFHEERAYEPDVLQSLLRTVGFQYVHQVDDYSAHTTTDHSERITFIVRKR